MIAINTNEPLVYPRHVPLDRPVLIADVSVPSAVSRHVRRLDHVEVIPLAGTILVPGEPDFVISAHTAPGTAFCCAAEAMLCGLENVDIPLRGKIEKNNVDAISTLAEKQGFFRDLGAIPSYKI